MISISESGASSLSKLLKSRVKTYRSARQRIYANAKKQGLKITQDNWFGVSDGNTVDVNIRDTTNGFVIEVSGKDVLFLEFGAGIKYAGAKHPLAGQMGYGPGTYPGKGYWDNPDGWFYETNDPVKIEVINEWTGKGYAHTYGNPAYAPTYNSAMEFESEFREIIKKELLR